MSLALSRALEPESGQREACASGGEPALEHRRSCACSAQGAGVWWRVELQEGPAPQTRLPDLPGL